MKIVNENEAFRLDEQKGFLSDLARNNFCNYKQNLWLNGKLPRTSNLVPRVLRLFGQPLVARRASGTSKNGIFFIGCSVTACIILPQKSCANKISVLQSLSRHPPSDENDRPSEQAKFVLYLSIYAVS